MPSLSPPALEAGRLARLRQPVITAGPLRLRPWTSDDVPVLVAAYSDAAIRQWHVRSMTGPEALAWVQAWPGRWVQESGAGWAVEVDGEVAGQLSLRRIRLEEGSAELSYWVLPAGRGRGTAVAALRAVTEWAFADVGIVRLDVSHSTRNPASCRVATKADYQLEGTARRQGLHADGWHDMHWHARVNPAVPGLRS